MGFKDNGGIGGSQRLVEDLEGVEETRPGFYLYMSLSSFAIVCNSSNVRASTPIVTVIAPHLTADSVCHVDLSLLCCVALVAELSRRWRLYALPPFLHTFNTRERQAYLLRRRQISL